jgi:hypothetical protein
MKLLLLAIALPLIAVSTAHAQTPVPKNQTYCLEEINDSGRSPLLCRYATLEQCLASRSGPSDTCWLNPYLAAGRR